MCPPNQTNQNKLKITKTIFSPTVLPALVLLVHGQEPDNGSGLRFALAWAWALGEAQWERPPIKLSPGRGDTI